MRKTNKTYLMQTLNESNAEIIATVVMMAMPRFSLLSSFFIFSSKEVILIFHTDIYHSIYSICICLINLKIGIFFALSNVAVIAMSGSKNTYVSKVTICTNKY